MRRTFAYLASSLILFVVLFLGVLCVFSIFRHHVPRKTVVKLTIEGDIVEQAESGFLPDFGKRETMKELLVCLDTLARDPRVIGLVVEIKPFEAGFGSIPISAKVQELRSAIEKVNKAGKWTAAYITQADMQQYYLASACREIFMLPTGGVLFNGIYMKSTFVRGLLDKLGIKPAFQHIGDYKTASNQLTEKKFTAAHKEMENWLADSLYKELVSGISKSRNLAEDKILSLVDKGVFFEKTAKEYKVVDELAYPEDLQKTLESEHGKYKVMSWKKYLEKTNRLYWGKGKKIAIVYANGVIAEGESGHNLIWGKILGSDTLRKAFEEIRKDPSIKAVVFRIDSPGGDAAASDIIRHSAELTSQKIPMVVSMSDVAGSGGYWITTFSPTVFADPGTLTASIGVVDGKFVLKDFYEKLGISFDFVTRGKLAMLLDSQSDSKEEREASRGIMTMIYNDFVRLVAKSRHMSEASVDQIGRGRVFTGEQAKEKGLVDQLGGLLDAIAAAKEKSGIKPEEPVQLVAYPKAKSLLQLLFSDSREESGILTEYPWPSHHVLLYMQP